MKRFFRTTFPFALLFPLILFPATASAQKWTPEQQELIDQIQNCWEAWDEAFANQDHAIWEQKCAPLDPETWSGWWASEGTPVVGLTDSRRQFKGLTELWDKILWSQIRPVDVLLSGDTAVVYYYGMWQLVRHDGKHETGQDKRVEFFQRRSGKWAYLGGMVTVAETQN